MNFVVIEGVGSGAFRVVIIDQQLRVKIAGQNKLVPTRSTLEQMAKVRRSGGYYWTRSGLGGFMDLPPPGAGEPLLHLLAV